MGKVIKSHLYWAGRIKQALKGKLDPKELREESEKELKDMGFVWNSILGWVMPAELDLAGVTGDKVPIEKGKVSPDFLRYLITKKIETARTKREREMIDAVKSIFGEAEEMPF